VRGGSMARSAAIAGAPARDQAAKERPHTERGADGLASYLCLFVRSFLLFLFNQGARHPPPNAR